MKLRTAPICLSVKLLISLVVVAGLRPAQALAAPWKVIGTQAIERVSGKARYACSEKGAVLRLSSGHLTSTSRYLEIERPKRTKRKLRTKIVQARGSLRRKLRASHRELIATIELCASIKEKLLGSPASPPAITPPSTPNPTSTATATPSTSPTSTPSATATTIPNTSDCRTSTTVFQNFPFAAQNGTFSVEYDSTPNGNSMDGVFELSSSPASAYSDFAVQVRFAPNGHIDVRNGSSYGSDTIVPYTAGLSYHFKIIIDVPSRSYSVFVTPPGGSELTLASNYDFRTDQNAATELQNYSIISEPSSFELCNFQVMPGSSTPGIMTVVGSGGFSASGPLGGPFVPSTKVYTVSNSGSQTIDFSVSKTQAFLTLSPNSGTLSPGQSLNVVVSINSAANALPLGSHSDIVTFTNSTNNNGSTSRSVSLEVVTQPPAGSCSSITQQTITWTFSEPRPCGVFASGDSWVVGPVSIIDINPAPDCPGKKNGTMKNPRFGMQGYDNRGGMGDWDPALCIPAPSVSSPLTLVPGDTIVSSKGLPAYDTTWNTWGDRAAVLTTVDVPQAPNRFRPPYARPTRVGQSSLDPLLFSTGQILWERLPQLSPVSNTPPLSETLSLFNRGPWIDHFSMWSSSTVMPINNMPNDGDEWSSYTGEAALQLLLNYSVEEKAPLAIHLIQLGIDLYGSLLDGGEWTADGGIFAGRKFPVLFAGLMLDHAGMLSPPYSYENNGKIYHHFQEDSQTYYFDDLSLPLFATNSGLHCSSDSIPGCFKVRGVKGWVDKLLGGDGDEALWKIREHGEYGAATEAHEHLHVNNWSVDPEGQRKSEAYRRCCNGHPWIGYALAAQVLGLKQAWGHNAFFDYVDRWVTQNDAPAIAAIQARFPGSFPHPVFWQGGNPSTPTDGFAYQMWFQYRQLAP